MLRAPDIVRVAYAELLVTDLERSKWFYRDVLSLIITAEEENTIYLRGAEEYLHHSLVLRQSTQPAVAKLAYRVRSPEELRVAETYFEHRAKAVRRVPAGATRGIGEALAVQDELGFPVEFFYDSEHQERLTRRYDLQSANPLTRLDHFNIVVPDVAAAERYFIDLGFRVSETIEDEDRLYASWVHRSARTHDVALSDGPGPRVHHIAFATPERVNLLNLSDVLGAHHAHTAIERGPGRHGVTNAFFLYLRDPDGHRIEIYASDYYTGDPDNPTLRWNASDPQRSSFWGHDTRSSWYTDASAVLDLDGDLIETSYPAGRTGTVIGPDGVRIVPPPEHRTSTEALPR